MRTFGLRHACLRIGVFVWLIATVHFAQADVRTVQFLGTVTSVVDPLHAFNGGIASGNSFTATVKYDLSHPGGEIVSDANSQREFYQYLEPIWHEPLGFVVNINGFTFDSDITGTPNNQFSWEVIDWLNGSFFDILNVSSSQFEMNVNGAASYNDIGMGVQLRGPYTTISNTDQPNSIHLTNWTGANTVFLFGNAQGASGFRISGTITAAVPEPSTLVLLTMLGLIGALVRRGGRRRPA